jgi:hypothetical protein
MLAKTLVIFVLIATISVTPAFASTIPIEIKQLNALVHYDIPYTSTGVVINSVTADLDFISLIFGISVTEPLGEISITFDRTIFDAIVDEEDDEFFILADGEEIQFVEQKIGNDRTLSFAVPAGTEELEIIGTVLFDHSFLEAIKAVEQKSEEEKKALAKAQGEAMRKLIEAEAAKTKAEYEARMAAQEESRLAVLEEACGEGTTFVDGECIVPEKESIDSGSLINSIFAAMGVGLAAMIILWGIGKKRGHKKLSDDGSDDS